MSLQLEQVHAHYGKSHVLQGVTLNVGNSEIICLLGRNGVGKSTTMKAIMGLVPPSGGSIRFKGTAVDHMATYRIARLGVGYVPEERRIFPTITVRENLLMGIKPSVNAGIAPWTLQRLYEYFPRLREREQQRAGTLSGGEQQMLTIGRTLMGNPELVLIDEPTEGLAPMIVEEVERIIAAIHQAGASILLVEQAIDTAFALAHRAYVMAKGTIVYSGETEDLKSNSAVRRQYLEV